MTLRRKLGALGICGLAAFASVGLASGKLKEKSKTVVVPLDANEVEETVKCKRGREAISAGFFGTPPRGYAAIQDSERITKRKWRLRFDRRSPGEETATLSVLCAKPRFRLRTVSATDTIVPPPSDIASITATCPQGREAVSGGFDLGEPGVGIAASRRDGRRAWTVIFASDGGPPFEATAIVLCDKRRHHLIEESETTTLGSEGSGSATARCRRNKRVVSGGFVGEYNTDTGHVAGVYGSIRNGRRRWAVRGSEFGIAAEADITAYAYCERK